jgi:N-methylhydantoinase A
MVVYGGNGPVHAGRQAAELGIRQLLVPKTSPAFSALGLVIADYVVDIQRSYITPSGRADVGRINEAFAEMEAQAARELGVAGLAGDAIAFQHYLAVCYPGQTFDMAVPARVDAAGRMDDAGLSATIEGFHDLHEETHTYAARDEEPIIRSVRVQAVGTTPKPPLQSHSVAGGDLEGALRSRRPAWFEGEFKDTPVYDGDRLGAGQRIEGPAVIEERFTTIVLHPGDVAEVDAQANYRITLPEALEALQTR